MIDNALAALPAIISRLKAECPDLREVYDSADSAAVTERQMPTPNAHVIYGGYAVAGSEGTRAGFGKAQIITQRFLVWISVKNARDQASKKETLLQAGVLFMGVFKALAGWTPIVGMKPLRMVSPPGAIYTAAFAYIPIAFQGDLVLTTE